MMRLSLLALLFIALASPSLSLKCYKCLDCDNNTPEKQDCSNSILPITNGPTCLKTVVKAGGNTAIVEQCIDKQACQILVKENTDAMMTYCCDTDLCNGAPTTLAGLGLLLVPALAYLAA